MYTYHIYNMYNDMKKSFVFILIDNDMIIYYANMSCLPEHDQQLILNSNPILINNSQYIEYIEYLQSIDLENFNLSTWSIPVMFNRRTYYQRYIEAVMLAKRHYKKFIRCDRDTEKYQNNLEMIIIHGLEFTMAEEYDYVCNMAAEFLSRTEDIKRRNFVENQTRIQRQKRKRKNAIFKISVEHYTEVYQEYRKSRDTLDKSNFNYPIPCAYMNQIIEAYLDATEDYSNIYDT